MHVVHHKTNPFGKVFLGGWVSTRLIVLDVILVETPEMLILDAQHEFLRDEGVFLVRQHIPVASCDGVESAYVRTDSCCLYLADVH